MSAGSGELERRAAAAYLAGEDAESTALWSRAYRERLAEGEPEAAARCAFWLWFQLGNRGEPAAAGGWLERARKALADRPDCAEHALLLVPEGLGRMRSGDFPGAAEVAARAMATAERHGDPDALALSGLLVGRSRIGLGDVPGGKALLDEVMVAVLGDETSGPVTGLVYCAVVAICFETFDLARAREWTASLSRWCEARPGMRLYRGQCQVHRSELMVLHGDWTDALEAAAEACAAFDAAGDRGAAGPAFYQVGQLHRLRGDPAAAEEAYREASRRGHPPQPGLALLRAAEGRTAEAVATVRAAVESSTDAVGRSRMLAAEVEILLLAGDPAGARGACAELATLADGIGAPLLAAMCAHAEGAIRLAAGDPAGAAVALRAAAASWQELDVPHEAARARLLLARACAELGDAGGAELERDAARWTFARLGAAPDLAEAGDPAGPEPEPTGLTPRELEVLRLVATGRGNRGIAVDLFLSERTVARHVSNILRKLEVPSRAAATAFAYEHGVV